MGTPELDSRLSGLQSYLSGAKGSEQESSDIYKEAHWLATTLQGYPSISQQFWTLFVHEMLDSLPTNSTLDQVRFGFYHIPRAAKRQVFLLVREHKG
ncbi:hypothetical protein N7516_008713 [Penicillium verrucosum]|uniref:uncharacterized protein n=1 Tax=Penicillium verrucosum TaxID=60171 RepID=UPI002544E1D0|nr:uncharacterized protein N7516_008713 [Penicillium verrucosum]KAJ5926940.1 hypothetical protein N7516_008713 [Penicillium verrucosum]